jgi:hypothetical protein
MLGQSSADGAGLLGSKVKGLVLAVLRNQIVQNISNILAKNSQER